MAHGGDLILSASGTIKYQNDDGDYKGTVGTYSFSEKDVFNLISNAVATASITGVAPTNIPKGSYIVFSPQGYDGEVSGTFYVTNKSGFYYPLSGFDTNDDYYSFIELDTTIYYADTNGLGDGYLDFGFYYFDDDLYQGVASYSLSKAGSGSDTSTSKALLYIHDNPYDYGDPNGNDYDGFYPFNDDNDNAVEIGGILTSTLKITDNNISGGSLSLSGSGNFILYDYEAYGVVSSGHASFSE